MSELRPIVREGLQSILDAAVHRSDSMKSTEVLLEFHCVICTSYIDHDRARRGATTCGPECAKAKAKRLRDWRASKACRLCGRKARRARVELPSVDDVALDSRPCAEAAQV